jgi:hypothetical protein
MSIERARAKDHRYLLHLRLIVTSLALLLCSTGILGLQGCRHSSNVKESTLETPSSHRVQAVYDGLLAATSFGRNILYSDNLTGRIVWNEAQFMESLINMYEVTRDRRHLEIFVEHADHVLQMRDDYARRLDYAGRLRPGWQAGAYYTLGVPVIIPDECGYPSLEIQGIRRAGNNYTVVEITQEDHGRFTLHILNDFRRSKPLEVKFEGLTLKNVEGVVNANTSPDSWVRVRVVGTNPPASGVWALQETYRMVIHELHTPIIGIPFLRFADLVFRSPELAIYQPKAEKYVQAFEESFLDYANSWREDAEGGFFVFEPGGKYWASGLPIPYNSLSANGRFLLWLYRVTGNTDYLEKAAAVAQKVRAGITFLPDGTMTMPYWVKDSLPYIGWENRGSDPVNGLYSRSDPDHATEDVSHFSLTLRFMVDAWQMGVVFQDDDLKAVARTFVERLWKPMNAKVKDLCDSDWRKGFYLAHNLDGNSRAYDYAIATFALLSRWEPTILSRALEVYEARYKDADCIDIDYLYGEVMLGWSVLAVKGVPPVIGFRQKPLYPFTLRVSAEEYVKSSRLVSLDEHGIPVTDYGALHGGAGRRYNPTFIANYALALYRDYLVTGDPALLQAFQNQVQWFLDHRTQREYQAWYEEVADEEAPSAKILNGHIAAVQALWTFWQWMGRAVVTP